MMYEQNTVRHLYKKLLAFYPRAFREQLAESMEQTFTDLCNEKRQTKIGLFSFVLWTFVETASGITKEYVLLITQGDSMKTIFMSFRSPAVISFLIILPFMILEFVFQIVNKPNALNPKNLTGVTVLFGLMWLLPVMFITTLTPITRTASR